MYQPVDLEALTKATRRREFDDGLMDFTVGLGVFFLCLTNWFLFSPNGIRWYAYALINHRNVTLIGLAILAIVVILGPLGMRMAIKRIRRFSLWKDRGFVKPLRNALKWPITLIAGLVMLGIVIGATWLMSVGRIGTEIVLRSLVASTGISTGILYFGLGSSLSIRRYLVVGLAGGFLSAFILFTPTSFSIAWLTLGAVWFMLLIASGVWGLRKTLSAKKVPADE